MMVSILRLPDNKDGSKQGVDDALASGMSLEDLLSTCVPYDDCTFTTDAWPVLADEALHGPAGEVLKTIRPNTESDPVAILMEFLSRFGNIVGRGAHFNVEGDTHYLKLWHVSVGETSKGRKGTAQGRVNLLMEDIDSVWLERCNDTGLSSGEGLVQRVRDPVEKKDKDGQPVIVDAGVTDKRLLIEEPEFASPLTVMQREGNTLSMVLRNAWDDKTLRTMTRSADLTATGTHITIIGHITKTDLYKHLSEARLGGGIANRFLFSMVKRSKILPFGGDRDVFSDKLLEDLRLAAAFGKEKREIRFSEEIEEEYGFSATEFWTDIYPDLSEGEPFLVGTVISRAEAQVRRLATLYAVLDRSREVRVKHTLAATAVWQYCEDSARILFGNHTGDRKADAALAALRDAGGEGLSKTELYDALDRNVKALELNQILKELQKAGWVTAVKEDTGKRGPRPERWYVTGGPE